jgi:mono/diheme cytochrome c family protein
MKKNITESVFALLLFIVASGSCSDRKAEPIKGKAFVPENEHVAHGEQVFMMYCEKCHPGGEKGLGLTVNGNPAPQFIKRFQMRHGLGVMPGFSKDEITKESLKDISAYLKALKRY